MTDDELNQWAADLLGKDSDEGNTWQEALEQALEENRALRDDNFVDPNAILVFTEATGTIEEVPNVYLPLRFSLQGKGARWSYDDLGQMLTAKVTLYRQSCAANDLANEYPDASPECGTVCLIEHVNRQCLSWCQVRARIDPALNR